jgi:hypothetical protein
MQEMMTMKTNPITPPRELVREWYGSEDCPDGANALANYLCTQAAQWGADQQLEATDTWIRTEMKDRQRPVNRIADDHRADMRPKPPSLKEQALEALQFVDEKLDLPLHNHCNAIHTIRRALEALDD